MNKFIYSLIIGITLMNQSCENEKASNGITNSTNEMMPTKRFTSYNDEKHVSVENDRGEANDYSDFPIDSIKINYSTSTGELYGYRKGDTLIIDGDIMIILPPKNTRGVATTIGLWQPREEDNRIIIRYAINQNYPYPDMVRNATAEWQRKTGIQFIEGNSNQLKGDYLEFVFSNATQSFIGFVGGRQIIELADWAREGNIKHEIGHALGLYHEQSRSDRDKYVQILCPQNLNYSQAFKEDPYARDIGQYNFYSIMHYPPVPGCMQIKSGIREQFKLPNTIPGQRDSITLDDIKTVKQIYRIR